MYAQQPNQPELNPLEVFFITSTFAAFAGLFLTSLISYETVQGLHLFLGGEDPANGFEKIAVGFSLVFKIFMLLFFTVSCFVGFTNAVRMHSDKDIKKIRVFGPLMIAGVSLGGFLLLIHLGTSA